MITRLSAVALAFLVFILPAHAAEEEVLETIFVRDTIERTLFSPELLNRANVEEVVAIVRGLKGTLGGFRGVQKDGQNTYTVFLERGRVPAEIQLDEQGLVTFLFFRQPTASGLTPQEALGGFVRLERSGGGQISLLVTRDGVDQVALAPDTALDAGSTFKMAVLKSLTEAVESGKLTMADVVTVDPAWRSLPSGILQDWPEGTPVTLATLATLMISISDNTATDALISILGRDAVEAHLPQKPLITTAEFFKLKADVNNTRARFRAAENESRADVLADLADAPLPEVTELDDSPSPEIGWPISSRQLCSLIEDVADQPAMQVNPGVANPEMWEKVAYKGGSNFGAFNMTTRLVDETGTSWCITATWNTEHSALDQAAFTTAYLAMIGSLTQAETP
ncbi:serine hydrolase [Pyruvatibacter sp. HU-CL02332]|uniref:serine hydrolase n=1 Tax=Pyruvatibacter sp. HU-CL02332 TaxID=3127650 RepID=UPI00310A0DDC